MQQVIVHLMHKNNKIFTHICAYIFIYAHTQHFYTPITHSTPNYTDSIQIHIIYYD